MTNPAKDDKGNEYRAFNMTDEGDLSDYLGVKIELLDNGLIKLCQPHLIEQILKDVGFKENTDDKPTPAATTVSLGRDVFGDPFNED